MANRYFKSGGTTWESANSWSATGSGGADNAGTPTAADEVIFEAGSGNCSIGAAAVCRSLNASAYAGTLSHGAYTLTIGDSTAPTGGVALVLAGTYTPNASSSIIFNSTGAGTHTIDTGGKTIKAITFSTTTTASYQFVTNAVTVTGTLMINRGTIDFNGLLFTLGQLGISVNNNTTINFSTSVITCSGTYPMDTTTSSTYLTINSNTATLICTYANPTFNLTSGVDYNGLTMKFTGTAGSVSINNNITIANLIIDPTTTKTLAITAGKTLTITGQMYCNPKAGVVTITGGTISKASGTVNLYQVASNTCTFTGGATWNLKNNCTALGTLGLTQVGGNFYIDLDNGDDTIYASYGWSKVAYTGATGTMPVLGETIHGETSGSTATVSYIDADWLTGSGTIWINTKSAAFQAETVHGNTGDGHFNISADFVNGAWKTISGGALAARIAQADINNISKTTNPTSIGDGKWTLNTETLGGFPATKAVSATSNNGGLIRVTTATQDWTTGDVIQFIAVGGTLEANGAWVVTVVSTTVVELQGSVYTNAWTSGGTAQKINSKAIVLTTAGQMNIDRCMINWSNGATGVSSVVTTDHKDGGRTIKCLASATPGTNTRQIYHDTGTLAGATMNGYQKLSFWIKNEVAIADGETWYIGLCSDTAGTTVIDKFKIPAIPSTGRWLPLTLTRDGGGNLGGNASTDVKSIAIWSGGTAPTASKYIYVNNFIACTTSGLNLQSLISKNGSAQGGTGAFYGIQSINGKVVLVDNDTNTLSNAGRGYYEADFTGTTYIRETFKTALASASSTIVSDCLDSGILGSLISYEFGYTVNGSQDGETFLDGLNGNGQGVQENSKSFLSINRLCACRYNNGITLNYGYAILLNNILNLSNCYTNLYSSGGFNMTFVGLKYNANGTLNIDFGNTSFTTFGNTIITMNAIQQGLTFSTAREIIFTGLSTINNGSSAINISAANNIYINNLISKQNTTSTITLGTGSCYLSNANITDNTISSISSADNKSMFWSFMEDGDVGNNWGYGRYCTINWQTTTKYSTNPGSWKVAITNAERSSICTVPLKIGEVYAPEANKLVTVTCYVKKDHATNIAAKLIVYADSLLGVVESYDIKASDTDWELLTITYTPTIANTVVDVYVESWWVAGSSNVYCGPITVNQAP